MTSKEFDQKLNNKFADYRFKKPDKLVAGSKYFAEIGSTQLEDIPYNAQLEIKQEILSELFNTISKPEDIIILPSSQIQHYRFKADFVVTYNPKFEPNNRMGQRKKGNFNWVVDLDEYILAEKEVFNKVREVYNYALSLGLNGYDLKKQSGDLRYLTIKNYQNEQMLIITSSSKDERFNKLIDFAIEKGFSSVYWLLNDKKQDTYEGEVLKFAGKELLTIPISNGINTYKFLVGPFTFFQNNIYCFETLISYVSKFLDTCSTQNINLYDLYCGVGMLGILFSNKFKKVKGIEIVQESIDLANKNKDLNNINNIEFECLDVKNISLEEDKSSYLIVDPPRSGLEDKGIENVLKINPEYVIYVSCNPVTLEQDLAVLLNNYQVLDLKAFDMFPLTNHVECLCILRKK